MKKLIIILVIAVFGFTANAQEVKKNKNAKVSFEVNGNCEMCQKRIQKAALSVNGVKSAVWNIESHQLQLILNETKTNPLTVKKAIAKVGHDTDEVKSDETTYKELHSCCQYERN